MRVVVYHSECADGIMCAYLFNEYYNKGDRSCSLNDGRPTLMFPGQYSRSSAEELYKFFCSLEKQHEAAGRPFARKPIGYEECIEGSDYLTLVKCYLEDSELFLADFSFSKDTVQTLCNLFKRVTLLDHHKSAIEDLKPLADTNGFDMSHSTVSACGCIIVDRFIQSQMFEKRVDRHYEQHHLLFNIDDYDRWKHFDPHTMALVTALYSYDFKIEWNAAAAVYDFGDIGEALKMSKRELVAVGEHILRNKLKQADKYIKGDWRVVSSGGLRIPYVNCPTDLASIVAGEIAKLTSVAMTYMDLSDRRIFSVRSNGEIDCAALAKDLSGGNGGGHVGAAGFSLLHGEKFKNAEEGLVAKRNSTWRKSLGSV